MNFYLTTALSSYLRAREIYKIAASAGDMVITEEDYNKMIEVIRGQGLEEKVDGEVHRWYGTLEEILRMVNAIELSPHAGPSFEDCDEDCDDDLFEEMLRENPDSDQFLWKVGKV